MSVKIIQGTNYKLIVHHDLLIETIFCDNFVLDEQVTSDIDAVMSRESPGNLFYVLSEALGTFSVTEGLQRAMASPTYSRPIAAIAFVNTELTLPDEKTENPEFSRPKIPIRFFEERPEALAWLREQMKNSIPIFQGF